MRPGRHACTSRACRPADRGTGRPATAYLHNPALSGTWKAFIELLAAFGRPGDSEDRR
jgi:hypothetical protein